MKQKNPLVSIIIPTLNRAHLIGETLDSVIEQTYQNWECIVIDDGSTDNTAEVMKKYVERDSRIQYHHRQPEHKAGGNGARNYGFKLSKGAYINWFDSDDIMNPEKLKQQADSLESTTFNFTVCQTMRFKDHLKNLLGLRHPEIESQDVFNDFIKQNVVFLTSAPLFRKVFLQQNNLLFDEDLKAAQEYDFFVKVLEKEHQYDVNRTPLVYHREHAESISFSEDKKLESIRLWNNFLVRYKLLNRKELPEDTKVFLSNKIMSIYNTAIKKGHFKEARKIYKIFIIGESNISFKLKIKAFTGFMSFFLFGRGERILESN